MKYTVESLSNLLYTNMLLVGRYKSGKTYSCATLHKLKSRSWVMGQKLLVFDFDNGCQPIIRQALREGWADELDIRRYSGPAAIPDTAEVGRSKNIYLDFITDINSLYDLLGDDNQWRDPTQAPYAIVVDSLTKLQDDTINYTLASRNRELGDPKVHGGAEYKAQQDKIVENIRALRALPCYSIYIAHETLREEQVKMPTQPKGSTKPIDPVVTGAYFRLPLVTGQLAFSIGGEFGIVLYSGSEQVTSTERRYYWDTQPNDNIYGAGSRLMDNLPPRIDADFDLVVEGSTDPKTLFKRAR